MSDWKPNAPVEKIKDVPVISVEVRFKGKTAADRAKHIEALMKLLDKRARSYKLARSK